MRLCSISNKKTLTLLASLCASKHHHQLSNNATISASPGIITLLRRSASLRCLRTAKTSHAFILRISLESDTFIANNLLHAYWTCGSFVHACHLFDEMRERDVVSWNTMISGYVGAGLPGDGFSMFLEMVRAGMGPSQSSFVSVLTASAEMGSLLSLVQIHGFVLRYGFGLDCCVGNAILKGYVELGELEDLRRLRGERCNFDEISFEIFLKGYSFHGACDDAFELFKYSHFVGESFSSFAVSSLVSLHSSFNYFDFGIQIHGYVVKFGMDQDVSVANSLITMYSSGYKLEDAMQLFEGCNSRDIVSWNSLIYGFAYNGEGDAGIGLVQRFLYSEMEMNESTFMSFLSLCASINFLENAKKAHAFILKLRCCNDGGSDNIILTMYCRSKALEAAVAVFESMKVRDIVTFNLMMGFYRKCSCYRESLRVFSRCQLEGIRVDELMFSGALFSCSELGFLDFGKQIHGSIVKSGYENVLWIKNSLLEMYSGGGKLDEMEKIFAGIEEPDLFSWNTMLIRYARSASFLRVFQMWREMQSSIVECNEFSCSTLLDACSCPESLLMGEQIHARIWKSGLACDQVLMNSLLTMYSNCQMMEKAFKVFEEIQSPDLVSWNAMVSGYAQNGLFEESVKFYKAMNQNRVETNHMTFASICMSCAMLTDLKFGTQLHAQIIKTAFELDVSVSNSLITTYAKSGDLQDSCRIFRAIVNKDVVTWNSMISAFAHYGLGREAIDAFKQMISSGMKPNNVTFLSVISACGRAGLISEAYNQFNNMHARYGIEPTEEHYACMVDILCRAGQLEKAYDLIESMPIACSLAWKTLLNACKINGVVELGEVAAVKVMELEPQDSASFVLLSDLYASVGKRHEKAKIRRMMTCKGVKKEAGCSWVLV